MGNFEDRNREPRIDEESNRTNERNAPSREDDDTEPSRPREGQPATPQEHPGEGVSRHSGEAEKKPTGEDVDSGNE